MERETWWHLKFGLLCVSLVCLISLVATQSHNISPTAMSLILLVLNWLLWFEMRSHAHTGMLFSTAAATLFCVLGIVLFWVYERSDVLINIICVSMALLSTVFTMFGVLERMRTPPPPSMWDESSDRGILMEEEEETSVDKLIIAEGPTW